LFMYKDTYSINSLKEQLIKSGYDKNLVEEVAKEMGKNGYNIH